MIRSKCFLCLFLILFIIFQAAAGAEEAPELPEPEIDYSTDIDFIHIGWSHVWKPFANDPDLPVTYTCSDPQIAKITEDGTITPLRSGTVLFTASVPETGKTRACETSIYVDVLPGEDGLYLPETTCHFFLDGKDYQPGELPLETERKLCMTQPDLELFLDRYLTPAQDTADPTEAALTAILNFGSQHISKTIVFDNYVSCAEASGTDWMVLLRRRKGMCAYNSSLFCYLMRLAGLPAMEVDSPSESPDRAHSWNLIEHDGFYYNLEEYHFLHEPRERYVVPPISKAAAGYFQEKIIGLYAVPFPVPDVLDDSMEIENLGRDLSERCPVLMYERDGSGQYTVRFDELRKGHIPVWSDGSPVTPEEITYKNMETDLMDGQYNEAAKSLFDEANRLLLEEISGLITP